MATSKFLVTSHLVYLFGRIFSDASPLVHPLGRITLSASPCAVINMNATHCAISSEDALSYLFKCTTLCYLLKFTTLCYLSEWITLCYFLRCTLLCYQKLKCTSACYILPVSRGIYSYFPIFWVLFPFSSSSPCLRF